MLLMDFHVSNMRFGQELNEISSYQNPLASAMVKRKKMKWRVGVGGSGVGPWYILHTYFLIPEPTINGKIVKPAVLCLNT